MDFEQNTGGGGFFRFGKYITHWIILNSRMREGHELALRKPL